MIKLTERLNKIYEKVKNARTKQNIFLAESIYGAKVIKIFNIQKEKMLAKKKLLNEPSS